MTHATPPAPDLSHWLTKREAADKLQRSERSIDRLIAKRELQSAQRPRKGAKPETVVNPDDIEFLMPQPHVMPPAAIAPDPAALTQFLAQAFTRSAEPTTPQRWPLWLSLQQAVEYSGLSAGQIDRLLAARMLQFLRRPLRISKASLDAHANADVPWIEP